MLLAPKRSGLPVAYLLTALALLGCSRVVSAAGNRSAIATAGDALGQVDYPRALAVDGAGNLYAVYGDPRGGTRSPPTWQRTRRRGWSA
jgi:hypothetical protein